VLDEKSDFEALESSANVCIALIGWLTQKHRGKSHGL